MIGRIVCYSLFGCLVIAFVLSFAGVQQVSLGNGFRNWLFYVNDSFSSWSFQIPKIPQIPMLDEGANFVRSHLRATNVVTVPDASLSSGHLRNVANMIFTFFNFLINILNVIVVIFNVAIQVIQFILTMIWCIKDIPQYLDGDNWASFSDELPVWWWQDIEEIIEKIKNGTFA